jgi:opacity protein-like surface antigen
MSVCIYSVFVLSCASSGLAMDWFPAQVVLLTVLGLKTEMKQSVSRISYLQSESNRKGREKVGSGLAIGYPSSKQSYQLDIGFIVSHRFWMGTCQTVISVDRWRSLKSLSSTNNSRQTTIHRRSYQANQKLICCAPLWNEHSKYSF